MTYTDDLGRTQAATVLVQHPSIPVHPPTNPTSYRCPACPGTEIAGPNSPSHARHQADVLADAGLLKKPFDLTRVEVDQRLGYPPHVRIDQGDIMIVNGYVMPDAGISRAELSHLGRHERSTPTPLEHRPDRPLEERLQALAADIEREAPFTAQIVRTFANEAAKLRDAVPAGFSAPSLACPECGNHQILGYRMDNEHGDHMHTHYVCTFWGSGQPKACGWHGWTVPGWDADLKGEDE